MITIEPFTHPRPVPTERRARYAAAARQMNRLASAALGTGRGPAATMPSAEIISGLCDKLTPAEQVQEDRYLSEVRAYNAAVAAYNARAGQAIEEHNRAVRAAGNRRAAAAVRAAACPRCLSTHPGEC